VEEICAQQVVCLLRIQRLANVLRIDGHHQHFRDALNIYST